ncbi:MAG: hypothetical protein DRP89_03110 [Candidatus Neomarinimicrobiota bacterium]|nr:MAG: hypothetical protein DRP89_03110 [Candidatus Neomarinimicrobiota bacterium]
MKLRIFYNKRLDISLIFFLLLFIISCENNPVNVIEKDSEIIFDYLNFDIEITDKTDSTCTINLKSTVIYHSENSGFQIFADGYYFYNSDRTDGFGMMADFYGRRISYPRHITLEPSFISAGEIFTLTYENQYTDIEIN